MLVWHFAAMPALCQSGVLEHLCPDDASAACSHEEDCSSDPCADSSMSAAKDASQGGQRFDSLAMLPVSGLHTEVPALAGALPASPLHTHACDRALQRTLPLLI